MDNKEITEKIIGCAYKVYNRMGFGFLESVYENCMAIEMEKAEILFHQQQEIKVFYENNPVGEFRADMVIDNIIIEFKSVRTLLKIHEVQLVNYLVATKLPVGLLINFGEKEVQVRRKFAKPEKTG